MNKSCEFGRNIQKIFGPPQSGKTFMLVALAKGYLSLGLRVVVICESQEFAKITKDIWFADIDVECIDYARAVLFEWAKLRYDCLLLDGCDRFPHMEGDGDPVDRVVDMYRVKPYPLVVVGTYCT